MFTTGTICTLPRCCRSFHVRQTSRYSKCNPYVIRTYVRAYDEAILETVERTRRAASGWLLFRIVSATDRADVVRTSEKFWFTSSERQCRRRFQWNRSIRIIVRYGGDGLFVDVVTFFAARVFATEIEKFDKNRLELIENSVFFSFFLHGPRPNNLFLLMFSTRLNFSAPIQQFYSSILFIPLDPRYFNRNWSLENFMGRKLLKRTRYLCRARRIEKFSYYL